MIRIVQQSAAFVLTAPFMNRKYHAHALPLVELHATVGAGGGVRFGLPASVLTGTELLNGGNLEAA